MPPAELLGVRTHQSKATGSHYTPPELSRFLAEKIVAEVAFSSLAEVRALDPACGDGELLVALARSLPNRILARSILTGIELDDQSVASAKKRLRAFSLKASHLRRRDFLDAYVRPKGQLRLFDYSSATPDTEVADIVIANPPYVRTQVLGAKKAQLLARTFGLQGRIDLYQVFIVAMTQCLRENGIIGIITSNRFISTRSGASIREFLRKNYEIIELIDLGDTKLFDAAVLPAVLIARKTSPLKRPDTGTSSHAKFAKIYQRPARTTEDARAKPTSENSVYDILRKRSDGEYVASGTHFSLSSGTLTLPQSSSEPWMMLTSTEEQWIKRIDSVAACRIGDLAKVRVGIKTTADPVFIRSDWNSIPKHHRPESCLLRPIFSHENATRWRSRASRNSLKKVLYTHEVKDSKRRAIDLGQYPQAEAYLELHRQRLEGREYLRRANRKWYEIWVPQNPLSFTQPKLIFPDISPAPMFSFDSDGLMVDGNCYWIPCEKIDLDLLFLIQGVANSKVMDHYHELCFHNKLYAGRRRYLTQYVQKYPLPDRNCKHSRAITHIVKELVAPDVSKEVIAEREPELDMAVARAFGVAPWTRP